MQDSAQTSPLDWEHLRRERLQLQRTGKRIPYISFILIHVAIALFLIAVFLVDHFTTDGVTRLLLRVAFVILAIVLLACAWVYAVSLSHRFKHIVQRWSQMEVAYAQQEQVNRLKDQFLSHVSHELRTPLTILDGYLEMLSLPDSTLDESTRLTFLKNAKQGCDELIELVSKILETTYIRSALDIAHGSIIPLAVFVRDTLTSFFPQEDARFTIAIEVAQELAVWSNKQALRQILRNLLSNAFRYCPPGTAITISAIPFQQLQANAAMPQVCLCVCDTGPGILPADQSLIFQQFVRLQRDLAGPVRGAGLGLYISKQLVEAMGGRIWVESSGVAGEGSRFCFLLPDVSAHVDASLPLFSR